MPRKKKEKSRKLRGDALDLFADKKWELANLWEIRRTKKKKGKINSDTKIVSAMSFSLFFFHGSLRCRYSYEIETVMSWEKILNLEFPMNWKETKKAISVVETATHGIPQKKKEFKISILVLHTCAHTLRRYLVRRTREAREENRFCSFAHTCDDKVGVFMSESDIWYRN